MSNGVIKRIKSNGEINEKKIESGSKQKIIRWDKNKEKIGRKKTNKKKENKRKEIMEKYK